MSQQINLLRAKRSPVGAAMWTLGGLGLLMVALLAYWQSLAAETARLRQTANAGAQKLAQVKIATQSLQKQKGTPDDAAALAAEIATLRPRAEAMAKLTEAIRSGSLGGTEGFSRYFGALGAISEDSLWLTGIAVSNGGSVVSISGRALRNESVMQYSRRVNQAFEPYKVHFKSLEIIPENVVNPGTAGAPVLKTVGFKLS
jgi:hypothetical protein